MIAWPLFVTGIVFMIAGLIGSIALNPDVSNRRQPEPEEFTNQRIAFIVLGVGILLFCACWWVGFGLEGWGR